MLARIAAAEEARQSREVRARLPGAAREVYGAAGAMFGAQAAFGETADPHGLIVLHAPKGRIAELADWLLAQGAERVSVSALEHVFSATNALYETLEAAIAS
jgi:ATP phosphoribosyltransferase